MSDKHQHGEQEHVPANRRDAISNVVVRRFGAREIAPQGQEVESTSTS